MVIAAVLGVAADASRNGASRPEGPGVEMHVPIGIAVDDGQLTAGRRWSADGQLTAGRRWSADEQLTAGRRWSADGQLTAGRRWEDSSAPERRAFA